MKNNNLEALANAISNGPFKEPMWTVLLVALDDLHGRIERLEEIERERYLSFPMGKEKGEYNGKR